MSDSIPILLLPGMAADERLFESQLARFSHLKVPSWIEPFPRESLQAYAARLAKVVDPSVPCIIGGASFGGIIALEMSPHLQTMACVLIGAARSPKEFPWRWRLMRPLAMLGPNWLGGLAKVIASVGCVVLARGTVRRLKRLSQTESAFVRWAICAVLRWSPSPAAQAMLVDHIHGSADRIFPVELVRPSVIVPGGSHALSLFRPGAVNDFLIRVIERTKPSANPQATVSR